MYPPCVRHCAILQGNRDECTRRLCSKLMLAPGFVFLNAVWTFDRSKDIIKADLSLVAALAIFESPISANSYLVILLVGMKV